MKEVLERPIWEVTHMEMIRVVEGYLTERRGIKPAINLHKYFDRIMMFGQDYIDMQHTALRMCYIQARDWFLDNKYTNVKNSNTV